MKFLRCAPVVALFVVCVAAVGCVPPTPGGPEPLPLIEARGIAAGAEHTCALLDDATVRCWGRNTEGQLGDGSTTSSATPVAVPGLTDVVSIAAGAHQSCAVRTDGTVHCWGWWLPEAAPQVTPREIDGISGVTQVALGGPHGCALTDTDDVWCWWWNSFGQLGNGTTENLLEPTKVLGLDGADVEHISAGAYHTCAALNGAETRCWGDNSRGQVGDGTGENRLVATEVDGLITSVQVAGGEFHTCARRGVGNVACWGNDGVPGSINSLNPTFVDGLELVTEITAGGHHSCVIEMVEFIGEVLCWGENSSGQLGQGPGAAESYSTPQRVEGIDPMNLTAGSQHTCSHSFDGTVHCWGDNSHGQLGDSTTASRATPTLVRGLGTPPT
jgi:alpha-tubulin suppressor-like RCC1 family protein